MLYIGDYFTDTLDFRSDQHALFQKLLLCLWIKAPTALKAGWLRKSAGLSPSEWRAVSPLLLPVLGSARQGIQLWKDSIRVYDGRRLPAADWEIVRTIVFARDEYTCVYCGSEERLHVDHRIPVSRGGSNGFDNLVTACAPCNQSKGPKLLAIWQDLK
jgi:5-methylcytosine-specific restriction endonuclease McrA